MDDATVVEGELPRLQFEVDRRPNVLMVPNVALRWHPSPDRRAASGLPAESTDTAQTSARKSASNPDSDTPAEATVWIVNGEPVRPIKVRTGLSDSTRSMKNSRTTMTT